MAGIGLKTITCENGARLANLSHAYNDANNKPIRNYKGGQAEIDERLEIAAKLDREAAYKSASWGICQIMGFNHKACGFSSVEKFVTSMKNSEDDHHWAFASFIKSNPGLHSALKKKDWATFAKGYNGPSYKDNKYDTKMANAYENFLSDS